MRSDAGSGFWAEGHSRHLEALAAAEQAERVRLTEALAGTQDPARRAELTAELLELAAKYRRLREAADDNLYFAASR